MIPIQAAVLRFSDWPPSDQTKDLAQTDMEHCNDHMLATKCALENTQEAA